MKKNILKSTKSIIFAVALCAVAALGALTSLSTSEKPQLVAMDPNFIDGAY